MALRLLTTLIFVFTFGGFAHAQTTTTGTMKITGLSEGYSRATGAFFGQANATITTIFGGLSGPNTNCSGSGLCNSCTGNTTGPCNTRRIHDDLQLNITFNYPSGDPGFIRVTNDVDPGTNTQNEVDALSKSSNGQVTSGSNSSYSVTLRWGEICSKVFGGSGCEGITNATSKRIRVGIDTDNDGRLTSGTDNYITTLQFQLADIGSGQVKLCQEGESGIGDGPCNFIVVAGDSKVFVEDVRAGTGFPSVTNSDADIQAIRIFYSGTGGFPTFATPDFQDLTVSTASSTSSGGTRNVPLTKNEVTGLTNGTTYHFAAAAVDEALNVGFFTDMTGTTGAPAGITDVNGGPGACYDPAGGDSNGANCHVATPDEVLGLIEKEFDCFITTATYGSPFRPKVEDFRKFRNTFLHPNRLGRKLIKFYYSTSPPIAKWIRNHPESKPVMRGILYPFWLFAKACLLYPLVTLTTMLLLLTSLFWQWRLCGAKR